MTAQQRVEALLSALPLREGAEAQVSGWAEHIALNASLGAVNERNWSRDAGTAKARAELAELAKLANRLGGQVQSLHRDTLTAMKKTAASAGTRYNPLGLIGDLQLMIRRAGEADAHLASRPPTDGDKGRKPKVRAAMTAKAAARAYERLTGLPATVTNPDAGKARGPYLDFLTAVFEALAVDASGETWAKNARKKKVAKEAH